MTGAETRREDHGVLKRHSVSVTLIDARGKEYQLAAEHGSTLMRAAQDAGVPGIVADCGGSMTCATCHVYLDAAWLDKLGPAGEEEEVMLEMAIEPGPNSRLSCQIVLDEVTDGLIVRIPSAQF